ncbi:hypothetical protein SteCoe_16715 [Stentor coeruleus]|uniref:Uncharacterized protein n=1 Tax=Stentor coeruleus TaxID=5963 RepID=A0A1R2C0M1_9CILI|nr:hypothetical protein SteCoe_16715 [Stentor coeruleus]
MLWPNPQKLYNIQTKSFEVHENKHKNLVQTKISPKAVKQINETIKLKKVENEYIEALKKKKQTQESFRKYKNRRSNKISEIKYDDMLFGIKEDTQTDEENSKDTDFRIENEMVDMENKIVDIENKKVDIENIIEPCIEGKVVEILEEKTDEEVNNRKDIRSPFMNQGMRIKKKNGKIKSTRMGEKEAEFLSEGKIRIKFPPICITGDSKNFVYIVGNIPPIFSSNYDKKHTRSLSPGIGKNELIDYTAKAHPAYYCYRDLDKESKKNIEVNKRRNKSTCKNCHSKININTSVNLMMEVEARKLKSLHNLQNFKFKKIFSQ